MDVFWWQRKPAFLTLTGSTCNEMGRDDNCCRCPKIQTGFMTWLFLFLLFLIFEFGLPSSAFHDGLCVAGRSYSVFSQRMLNQCLESLVQKIQSGVVINFEKTGPDPPPLEGKRHICFIPPSAALHMFDLWTLPFAPRCFLMLSEQLHCHLPETAAWFFFIPLNATFEI